MWIFPRLRAGCGVFWETLCRPDPQQYLDCIAFAEYFDPKAFSLSVSEAAAMHPQQRWTMEVANLALEDSGLLPARATLLQSPRVIAG